MSIKEALAALESTYGEMKIHPITVKGYLKAIATKEGASVRNARSIADIIMAIAVAKGYTEPTGVDTEDPGID